MKQLFLMLVFVITCSVSFAQYVIPTQPSKTPKKIKTVKPVVNQPSYIVIFRGGQLGAALSNYNIFVDGRKICKLSNGRYLKYKVTPGKHEIEAKKAGVDLSKKEVYVNVVTGAGRSSYISCNVKTNLLREKVEMLEVMESSGKKSVSDLKEDNCQDDINNK
ncbi:DUF2846 domain-containing protein [Ferruginibacter sp.]